MEELNPGSALQRSIFPRIKIPQFLQFQSLSVWKRKKDIFLKAKEADRIYLAVNRL